MVKDLDFIQDINEKYGGLEFELHGKLEEIVKMEHSLQVNEAKTDDKSKTGKVESFNSSTETMKRRNHELLKSLEISKARLRSRATFSPLESILQKAIGNYLKETSLVPCSTKKVYGPTYV
ncbi:uncharacterized protein LOC120900528 [Anopheles arabiensis]|uniref:Uncharacterized protein n=1 Tax=Anopheles arabiensis TaxID=7173 RepID=A0A182I0T3_ANOAR|nr:uncharacterized protein LOC120900528 [Anopheles arabiensis]